jgi:hypothetical protein
MTVPARVPGFLSCLKNSTPDAPSSVVSMVDKAIEIHNFNELLQYYEIRDVPLANNMLQAIVAAASEKMDADASAHVIGTGTFTNLITQAVAFGIVAGAHLAKERVL